MSERDQSARMHLSLKVKGNSGFDCRCRTCGTEGKIVRFLTNLGEEKLRICCPRCKHNFIIL